MFPKIVQDPYDPNSFLPAGWGIAMLPDGRRYFFNPLLWLSSWAIPKEEWSNDCPVGFAKYFDQNGEAFVFDAKLGKAVGNAEGRVFVKKCPCCKYDCSDVKEMVCPACNSVIRSFLCVCAKQTIDKGTKRRAESGERRVEGTQEHRSRRKED